MATIKMWSHKLERMVDVDEKDYMAFCDANALDYREKWRRKSRGNVYTSTYTATRPFDGIDPKKWPNTFRMAMMLYFSPDWWKDTILAKDKPDGQSEGKSQKETYHDGSIGY